MSAQRTNIAASVAGHLVLVAATIIALYPVLWVLKMALTPSQAFDSSPSPIPHDPTLANFAEVVSATHNADHWLFGKWLFGRQLSNSLFVAVATTAVGILMSCTAAYAFSRFRFPGREVGLGALLLTQIFPGVVMVIPLYILLDKVRLLDSLWGLVLVYSTTAVPFCTFMLKGYFDTIPADMEESALVDGASRWTIFWRITLPLARPALAVTALFSFMTAWNEFILAYTFLNDAGQFTLPVALQRHVGEHDTDWGLFAAGAIIVSVPVMALFYALQRHLVSGLTAGSVKG